MEQTLLSKCRLAIIREFRRSPAVEITTVRGHRDRAQKEAPVGTFEQK